MDYKDWKSTYEKIVSDFNYSVKTDEKAADALDKLLQEKKNLFPISMLKDLINNREIMILGAGPSLEKSILKHKIKLTDKLKIAADGTTTALIKNNIRPDIIVTDLDGKVSDQLKANSEGSIAIIHAHGDNINKIKKYVPKLEGKILGTTQINPEPYDFLYNFGGFTDGDRAVYLADHFHAKKIYLMGFDFNGKIGEYSFAENKDKKLKLRKLKWCEYLIDMLNK
ncbi:MAG: DUF115 domain-containing protein [Thermoplasmatales archaeon]|nr:DUF115 domain-containing protein [Thermoplasmatales archaeon]